MYRVSQKMSPYTNYSSFVKRALLYLWEFKIVSKPNRNTKMSTRLQIYY